MTYHVTCSQRRAVVTEMLGYACHTWFLCSTKRRLGHVLPRGSQCRQATRWLFTWMRKDAVLMWQPVYHVKVPATVRPSWCWSSSLDTYRQSTWNLVQPPQRPATSERWRWWSPPSSSQRRQCSVSADQPALYVNNATFSPSLTAVSYPVCHCLILIFCFTLIFFIPVSLFWLGQTNYMYRMQKIGLLHCNDAEMGV